MIAGLTPLLSLHNVVVLLLVFILRVNLAAFLLGLALFFSRDLIKAREIRKQMYWQAKHDSLTRLPNRVSFEQKIAELIEDAATENNTHVLCFLEVTPC